MPCVRARVKERRLGAGRGGETFRGDWAGEASTGGKYATVGPPGSLGHSLSEDPFVNNMFYQLADKLCRREFGSWQCQTPKVATGTRRSEEQLIKEVNHKKY